MTATHSTSQAAKAGRWLGRAWWKLKRQEKQFAAWLCKKGVPIRATAFLLWIVKMSVTAAALYFFLLVGVIIIALLIITYLLSHAELSSHQQTQSEWRYGVHGFGLYDRVGFRIDPHDPNDEY